MIADKHGEAEVETAGSDRRKQNATRGVKKKCRRRHRQNCGRASDIGSDTHDGCADPGCLSATTEPLQSSEMADRASNTYSLSLRDTLLQKLGCYCNSFWSPYRKSDIEALEKLQKRATNILPHLKHLKYQGIVNVLECANSQLCTIDA